MAVQKEDFLELFEEFLAEKAITTSKPVVKSINEDKRLFTAVVLRPEVVDAHGDIYDFDVVEKACHDFTFFCGQGNIQHVLNSDVVKFVESYIAPFDYTLGEGEVKKGDWVATARIDNDELWEMCKDGTFTGFSIGCTAVVEDITDDET